MSKVTKGWKEIQLKDVLDYDQPIEYIVETPILEEETQIPVLTANKSFIKGYTNETKGIYNKVPVIIFDDFTADNKFVNFPFKVKSSAMKILKLNDKSANLKFIFYQMQLIDVNTTTHKRYYISLYQNLPFIFPVDENGEIDLEKQEQIIEKIEKQFTRLDASAKDLKSIKEKLDVYRKSVLNKTYKGNSNWIKSTIGDSICKIEQVVPQNSDFKEFTYIDIASIDNTKQKIVNKNKVISLDAPSRARQLTFVGDIVFSTVRTYLKNIAIIPEINGTIISSTGFAVLRPKKTINRNFMYYYLLSDKLLRDINKMQVGTSYPAIRKNDLLEYDFSYPESELEQEKIIGDVESHFSIIDKLEQTVDSALLKTEQLKKSILKSAFEGKLVKNNA